MADEKKLIIGIDMNKDFVQASYFTNNMDEPESVILGFASHTYHIPMVAYKKKGDNKWAFGDSGKRNCDEGTYVKVTGIWEKFQTGEPILVENEKYLPKDIFEGFFKYIIRECVRVSDIEKVEKISICAEPFQKNVLDNIKEVLKRAEFEEENILFLNRTECFIYYALSVGEELYQRGVSLYDFEDNCLRYSYMNYANVEGKTIVMVDSERERINVVEEKAVDRALADIVSKLSPNGSVSAVYLTGAGFEKYEHLDEFVKIACNRRRAFIGQNLYAKGAAWGAFEYYYGGNYQNRVLACQDRILSDIDIDIVEREKDKVYRAVRVGTNWYMAGKKLRFILDEADEIRIHINPIERKPNQDISISLEDFPKRPKKMTKIQVEIDFGNASLCKIAVKDLGFGAMYKASDKVIYRDIRL